EVSISRARKHWLSNEIDDILRRHSHNVALIVSSSGHKGGRQGLDKWLSRDIDRQRQDGDGFWWTWLGGYMNLVRPMAFYQAGCHVEDLAPYGDGQRRMTMYKAMVGRLLQSSNVALAHGRDGGRSWCTRVHFQSTKTAALRGLDDTRLFCPRDRFICAHSS